MALIVSKFGGSSVADAQKLANVASIVTDDYKRGNDVVVVVSAQGDTTDDLIAKANEINPACSKREMDMLLSTGEQISISLLAMAIERLGFPVISLTGWQAGMQTDSGYGSALIMKINSQRLRNELDKKKIVIVAGFQGINKRDDITTLGRGGSDTTAVAIAAELKADICRIYTDVDGVFTADPRIVKNARKLDEISYDEMLELASQGAQVLHNRSVELAMRYGVQLEVLSSFSHKPGTIVKQGGTDMEKTLVSGVAKDMNVAVIALVELDDVPGIAYRIFSELASKKINVDIILQSIGREGKKDISFTIAQSSLPTALPVLESLKETLGFSSYSVNEDIAKISVVGAGMANNHGVAASMFEALYNANVNIHMISTSEIKVSVLVDKQDANRALQAVHDRFFA